MLPLALQPLASVSQFALLDVGQTKPTKVEPQGQAYVRSRHGFAIGGGSIEGGDNCCAPSARAMGIFLGEG